MSKRLPSRKSRPRSATTRRCGTISQEPQRGEESPSPAATRQRTIVASCADAELPSRLRRGGVAGISPRPWPLAATRQLRGPTGRQAVQPDASTAHLRPTLVTKPLLILQGNTRAHHRAQSGRGSAACRVSLQAGADSPWPSDADGLRFLFVTVRPTLFEPRWYRLVEKPAESL
jgi:hypothetical protein